MVGAEHIFSRGGAEKARISHGRGAELFDTDGRRYLDGSGGAIVVGVGHGRTEVVEAAAAQASRVSYVHGTMFATEALEEYSSALATHLPMSDARIFPVSGGSEANETALKMARSYHLARGEDRYVVIGRQGAYHGNTRGSVDVGGKLSLRRGLEPWLGPARHTTSPYEYRCPFPDSHPQGCGVRHAEELDRLIGEVGPEKVAAFIAEPVSGAALGACVPPEDYWPAISEVCRRHGILLIADEVMTGFGRTGTWFGCEHWGVRPDLLTAGKGAGSGYWPLGLTVASGEVHEVLSRPGAFTHGFTYSHHVVGAATGLAVLRILEEEDLVAVAERRGALLGDLLRRELGDLPGVGDVRGLGMMWAIEFVADRETREPFDRSAKVTERMVAACREHGVLVYPGAGCADGVRGDMIMLGPPLVMTEDELTEMAGALGAAAREVLGAQSS